MGRILSIDYGEKRTGLAISDESKTIATPLKIIEINKNENKLFLEIASICRNNQVEEIVLGLPQTLKGEEGRAVEKIKNFAKRLKKEINLPIFFEDERLSTSMAYQILPRSRKSKKDIDKFAAAIILESYLEKRSK